MKRVESRFKYVVMYVMLFVVVGPVHFLAWASSSPPIHETTTLVNNYWIGSNKNGGGLDPGRAVYQLGNLALYRTFCAPGGMGSLDQGTCDAYLQHSLDWAKRHNWQLHTSRKQADNQAVGQVYLELYELCQASSLSGPLRQSCNRTSDTFKLKAVSESIDQTIIICIKKPLDPQCRGTRDKQYDWSWIDAIFMSGPVFSKFGADSSLPHLLGYASAEYFEALSILYNETKEDVYDLYDEADHLWYRDTKSVYLPEPLPCPSATTRCRTPNNQKSFWSRGNGWVIAALARILDDSPPDASQYREMLRHMAGALKDRQRPDGFWNVSLGDANDFSGPETSGTALFVYAIAWGINNGVLSESVYTPVALKGWDALVNAAVQHNGRLAYVQRAANEPCDWMHPRQNGRSPFSEACTWNDRNDAYVRDLPLDAYGVGPFLLAGSEVAKLSPSPDPPGCSTDCLHIVQAESADIGGGAIKESEHDGFHGSGYVNFPRRGGYIEWEGIDGGPGGLTTLSFRHALRPGRRTASLVINGFEQPITFESTGDWTNWLQLEVETSLDPGPTNTIRVESTGQDSANIDEMSVARQAEDDRVSMGGGSQVESDHGGHHGTGFVNFPRSGGFIEWSSVDGGECGDVILSFRHALGAGESRTGLLIINGIEQSITFASTGAWTDWQPLDVRAGLNPNRANTIRLASTGQDIANIDELLVTDDCP